MKIQHPIQRNKPLITVITASFNSAKTIKQCIMSVLDQHSQEFEYIVVDGASNDGSFEIAKTHLGESMTVISEPDSGIYQAFNKGLSLASGDWVCFLGADDVFSGKNVLSDISNQINSLPNDVNLIYTKVKVLNNEGNIIDIVGEPWDIAKHKIKFCMSIPHQGLFVKLSLFKIYGNFDESFRIAGDYDFILRVIDKEKIEFKESLVTVLMGFGGVSSDPKNTIKVLNEARKALRKNGYRFVHPKLLLAYLTAWSRLFLCRFLGTKKAFKLIDLFRKLCGLKPYWTKIN